MNVLKFLGLLGLTFSASLFANEGGITTEVIIEQIGKFHPLVLHFPAVLVPLTLITMILGRFIPGQEFWRKTTPYFLHGATVMAIATSTLGLLLASNIENLEGTLYYHRLFALILTGWLMAVSAFVLVTRPNFEEKASWTLMILTLISASILGVAAHFGGITTHGELFIILEYL